MEVLLEFIKTKRFINRGFLIGPYCPIYGVGAILMTFVLEKYKSDILISFLLAMILCGILEYITSYLMEKLFNARWWEYSHHKFNINGRVSLPILTLFGIGGCFVIYIFNPFFLNYLVTVPNVFMHISSAILVLAIIVDTIVSFEIILEFKTATIQFKDSTEEISKKVKEIISQKSLFGKRLIEAFPDLEMLKKNIKYRISSSREDYKNMIKKISKMKKYIKK